MFNQPLISPLSEKIYDVALIVLVSLMFVAVCAEADIYVPAFPHMIRFFGVEENQIQLILSLNFLGLSIAGLVTGPLSDSFGRKIVLLGGLFLFVISSLGCVLTSNFNVMLFCRLIQGTAASVPMVVAGATLLDKYSAEKAGQLIGLVNSLITLCMAGAPVIGAWVTLAFNWQANFVVILALAATTFLGTVLFLGETLPVQKRKPFHLTLICKDYVKLAKSFEFLSYSFIVLFPFTAIVVYISNLSVIFVNHMGISLSEFSYYQASTMGTFLIFSLLSIKLIGKKGIDYTKNLGGIIALIGSLGAFYISQTNTQDVTVICIAMAWVAAGGALMAGTFGIKALSVFPDMNGTALALITAMRQLMAAGLVLLSEVWFDGTIVPVMVIISGYATAALLCFIIVSYLPSKSSATNPQPS